MGLSKTLLVGGLGTFQLILGVYLFGYYKFLSSASVVTPEQEEYFNMMNVASILLMVVGGMMIFVALLLWFIWVRARIFAYQLTEA